MSARNQYPKLFNSWRKMRERCLNPNAQNFSYYGGRGITVCKEWSTFEGFLRDMKATYKEGLTIDRIDPNRNYYKENCRWATMREQNENTRRNSLFTFMNKTMTLSRWSELLGFKLSTLKNRIYKYGWDIEKTLSTPARKFERRASL